MIAGAARKFIGLEILESTERRITLQSLLDSSTVSVEQSTVQLERVALSMHEDAMGVLFEGDEDLLEHVVERDDQVHRLFALVSRHFQRSLKTLRETEELDLDQSRLYDLHTTARQLERVADHAEKIARLGARFETVPPADFEAALTRAAGRSRRIVERATSTLVRGADIDTAYDALTERDELTADLQDLERELHERDVADSHLVAFAIDSLVRTAEYGGNVAEAALQSAARDRQL